MWLVQSSKNQNLVDLYLFEEEGKYNFIMFKNKPVNEDVSVCGENEFYSRYDKILFKIKLDK